MLCIHNTPHQAALDFLFQGRWSCPSLPCEVVPAAPIITNPFLEVITFSVIEYYFTELARPIIFSSVTPMQCYDVGNVARLLSNLGQLESVFRGYRWAKYETIIH